MVSEKLTGWQPIETAPEEGGFLVARPDMIGFALHGTRDLEKFPESGWSGNPTHWQPLPAPPGTTRAPADLRSALEAETIERAARAMCVHDGLDPDEHIIGGQATGFEDYGPLWQAEQRSEGQLGITDYAGLARAALAPTKEPAA